MEVIVLFPSGGLSGMSFSTHSYVLAAVSPFSGCACDFKLSLLKYIQYIYDNILSDWEYILLYTRNN